MELLEKIMHLETNIRLQLIGLQEAVDEASDDEEGVLEGRYDFGHTVDSFVRGQAGGIVIGEDMVLRKILGEIESILK